jgi:hypothetical protein
VITLKSDTLTVSVLHPVDEAHLLGTRYCTGGFVYQIDDARLGALLSGPTYPDAYNLFDGQGIPDAFMPHLEVGEARVLGIGIGLIDTARNAVLERCAWRIREAKGRLELVTDQAAGGWGFTLERVLTLEGRTLRSSTRLVNTAKKHVPFIWYPHPFYPLFPGGECCKFALPVIVPPESAYEIAPSGFLRMKGLPWINKGHFQIVGHPAAPMQVLEKHPLLGVVAATTSFAPAKMPVWGNGCTFSFEPYYERIVPPGEEARWSVTYDF